MSKGKATAKGAFDGLTDMLSVGDLGGLTDNTSGVDFSLISIEEIAIRAQVRGEMEDDENTLAELASSIKLNGVIQPIVIRPVDGALPFALVAGERRLRAAMLAGLVQIPAIVRELSDEEAERIQFAENIDRKNLTQLEEARRLQKEIESLGSIDAVMEKYSKSRSWISKRLSVLDLGPEATRLLSEKVTADLEVISTVRQIEKVDPSAAAAVVEELKTTSGQKGVTAREVASAAKEKVKPRKPKEKKSEAVESAQDDQQPDTDEPEAGEQSGAVPAVVLDRLYSSIREGGDNAQSALGALSGEEREGISDWLRAFYDAGVDCQNLAEAVLRGLRVSTFAQEGHGSFALVAFLCGGEVGVKFNLLDVLGSANQRN